MKINPWFALTIGLGSFAAPIHCAEMAPEAQKLLDSQTADLAALSLPLPPETALFDVPRKSSEPAWSRAG